MTASTATADLADAPVEIGDRDQRSVILCALSRFIASERGRPPGRVAGLGMSLELYARTEILGKHSAPAPIPDFRSARRPTGNPKAVLARMELTPGEISRQWRAAELADDLEAQLPEELIAVLMPLEFWAVVGHLIDDGPTVARRRIEQMLLDKSQEEARPNRKRRHGKISAGTLHNYATVMGTLMGHLVVLQDHPSGLLERWTTKPAVREPRGAPQQPTDTSAPPTPKVRLAAKRLHQDVLEVLGCRPGEELEAINRLPEWKLKDGLFRRLRGWAYFGLLAISASRNGALSNVLNHLCCEHFDERHRQPNGVEGPAIVLDPQKKAADGTLSWKPLTGPVARQKVAWAIQCWLAYRERLHGQPLSPGAPLFTPSLSAPHKHWDQPAVQGWFNPGSPSSKSRAVIPYDETEPNHGYSAHRFRAAATKMLESPAATEYLLENQIQIPQRFLADCLTDHSMTSMAAVYNQVTTPEGREDAAAVATEILAEIIFTDRGARKALDGEGYREGLRTQRALLAEQRKYDERHHKALEMLERGDAKAAQAALAKALQAESRRKQITAELARLELDLERIKSKDPRRFVAIPDTAPDSSLDVDLEMIEEEVLGRPMSSNGRQTTLNPVRDWHTIQEVAELAPVTSKTARHWSNGEHLPKHRPWEANKIPIDDSLGPNRRRVLAHGINPEWLADRSRRQRSLEMRADWPRGWAEKYWRECALPPQWMIDEGLAKEA